MDFSKFLSISINFLLLGLFLGTFFFLSPSPVFAQPILTLSSSCAGVAPPGGPGMVSPGGPFMELSWTWGGDPSAEFQIFRKVRTGSWESFGSRLPAGTTSFTDRLVQTLSSSYHQAGTLSYYVQAIWSGGTAGTEVDAQSIDIPRCIPFLLVESICQPAAQGFHLYWTATKDVALYDLFRNAAPSFVQVQLSGNANPNFNFGVTRPGYLYYEDGIADQTATNNYWVQVFFSGSNWQSNEVLKSLDCRLTAPPPDPPIITKVDPFCESGTDSRIRVEWTPSPSILHYTVWRRVQGDTGPGVSRGDFIDPFMNDNTQGSEGTNYQYRIEAVGTGGSSFSLFEPGNAIAGPVAAPTCNTPFPSPDFVSPTPDANCTGGLGVDIAWVESVGAEKYQVFRQAPTATELTIYREFVQGVDPQFSSRTWRDIAVDPEAMYSYQMKAVGQLGTTPSQSAVKSVTTPNCSPPGSFTLTDPPSLSCRGPFPQATLSWTTSTNATSYDIFRNRLNPDDTIAETKTFLNGNSPYADFVGNALDFISSDFVGLSGLSVNTASGAKNTVEFWMYWKGGNNQMPFGWANPYDLFLYSGCFGFNTGQGNVFGVSSTGLANRWAHVVAVFFNGVPNATDNELYIDGVKQDLFACWGTTSASREATSSAHISGWAYGAGYYFGGMIDEVRIYSRALSSAEVRDHERGVFTDDTGLVGRWYSDDVAGQVASDSSGNEKDGQLGSTPGVDANDPTWVFGGLQSATKYSWQVEAKSPGGTLLSNTTSPIPAPVCAPSKPVITSLTPLCTGGISSVQVGWSFTVNTERYEIYRDGSLIKTILSGDPEFSLRVWTDNNGGAGLTPGTLYTYQIKGIGPTFLETMSDSRSATAVDCTPPSVPANVTAAFECTGAGGISPHKARITWEDSVNATSYTVYRYFDPDGNGIGDTLDAALSGPSDDGSPTYTFFDGAIFVDTGYVYYVEAFGPGGVSGLSAPSSPSIAVGNYCVPSKPSIKSLTTMCEAGDPFAELSWTDGTNFNTGQYELYRNTTGSGPLLSDLLSTLDPSTASITSGLVAYWNFNEGSGGVAGDSSGQGNDGTLVGGPAWVSGRPGLGRALRFDGVDDRVDTKNFMSSGVTAFTLQAWVMKTATKDARIVYKNNAGNTGAPVFGLASGADNRVRCRLRVAGGTTVDFSAGPIPLNTWAHVACTYDGSMVRAYLNGVEVGRTPKTGTLAATSDIVVIGQNEAGTSVDRHWPGLIDEVRVYNRALSTEEIRQFAGASWKDTDGLVPLTQYYYWVKGVGPAGGGAFSDSKTIQTLACGVTPAAPSDLAVTANECVAGRPSVQLDWTQTPNTLSHNVLRTNPDASVSVYRDRTKPFVDRGSYAVNLDGVDDYMSITVSSSLAVRDFTLSLWIKPKVEFNAASPQIQFVRSKGSRFEITYNVCGSGLGFAIAYLCGSPANYVTTLTANTWYHIAGTYNDLTGLLALYVNGALVASRSIAPGSAATDDAGLCIGANCGPARFTNAILDDFRIYNRALSDQEVSDLWSDDFVSPYGLAAMWHFDEGSGTSAKDDSGNGNTATLLNAPTWAVLTSGEPTHDADALANNAPYIYRVHALGVDTGSGDSNTQSVTSVQCGPQERIPTLSNTCDLATALPFISLTWAGDPNTQYWDLWRENTGVGNWAVVAPALTATSYEDKSVAPGVSYRYYLEAWSWTSPPQSFPFTVSSSVLADPVVCPAPAKPQIVSGGTFSYCAGAVPRNRLEWTEDPIAGRTQEFRVLRDGSLVATTTPSTTTSINNLTLADSGITYSYVIEAIGVPETNKTPSDPIPITTKTQCDKLPPQDFNVFLDSTISRGNLRAAYLEWTDAQTEQYYEVFRASSSTQAALLDAVLNEPFSSVFTKIATLTRGVDYVINDPGVDRVTFTDCDDGGVSCPPANTLEDGIWYWYRVVAYRDVGGNQPCDITGQPNILCRGADTTDGFFLPVGRPGSFTMNPREILTDVSGNPTGVRLTWTAAASTAKGALSPPPAVLYTVERSRTLNFAVSETIGGCVDIGVFTCDDNNPRRGLIFYRVKATNNGGDTFSTNAVQAGLFLFPEKFQEILPF